VSSDKLCNVVCISKDVWEGAWGGTVEPEGDHSFENQLQLNLLQTQKSLVRTDRSERSGGGGEGGDLMKIRSQEKNEGIWSLLVGTSLALLKGIEEKKRTAQ